MSTTERRKSEGWSDPSQAGGIFIKVVSGWARCRNRRGGAWRGQGNQPTGAQAAQGKGVEGCYTLYRTSSGCCQLTSLYLELQPPLSVGDNGLEHVRRKMLSEDVKEKKGKALE